MLQVKKVFSQVIILKKNNKKKCWFLIINKVLMQDIDSFGMGKLC